MYAKYENNLITELYDTMPVLYKETVAPENLLNIDDLNKIHIYEVDENTPSDDPFRNNIVLKDKSEWTFDEESKKIIKQYNIYPCTFLERKQLILEALAALRYEKEISGIIVNGSKIATDRSSQSMLNSAVRILELDNSKTINWKCEDGWVILDSTTVNFISQCVIDYVEACFNNEMNIWNTINNVNDDDWVSLQSIDININWPDNTFNT